MKIVFVSVSLNIHQIRVADELWRLTNGAFHFIETKNVDEDQSKGGSEDFSNRPYLIKIAESKITHAEVLSIIYKADVMIYGAAPIIYLKERIKTGKLTFVNSERWLKKGILNLFSPNLIRMQWFYHMECCNKPVYALCSSAYAASDYKILRSYKDKCFKWGYFIEVSKTWEKIFQERKSDSLKIKILWVGRFLKWKHPEYMIQLALKLRQYKFEFLIEMIGVGAEFDRISSLIKKHDLEKCVALLGTLPNNKVVEKMQIHDIFCFTSDCNEGWGVVLNEAMSVGCCPVASIEAGSTPYLIKNEVNGLMFNPQIKNDLFEKVYYLVNHPEERERMSLEAYKTIRDVWSPKNAAEKLYALSKGLLSGFLGTIKDGPCSKAD